MRSVRLTPQAAVDLAEIKSYIAEKLCNPSAADHTVRGIIRSLRVLQEHPEAGPSLEARTGCKTDLRYLVCGQYLAFYRIEGPHLSVARILNGRMDYLRMLFRETE